MSVSDTPERLPAGSRALRALAWLLVIGYFVAGLGYLAFRYLVWPNPELWLPYAERALSESVDRPLRIGPVRAGTYPETRPRARQKQGLRPDRSPGKDYR